MTKKLSFLVIGAGAIGTYFGGSLLAQGHTVVFLERSATAQQLTENGLIIDLGETTLRFPNPAVTTTIEQALSLTQFHAGILAVKSYHTSSALQPLIPVKDQIPPIICLQNGVENEAMINDLLGPDKAIPATLTSAVGKPGPGHIRLEKMRGMGLAGSHPLISDLMSIFDEAGLNPKYYNSAPDMKWSKMLTNLLANPLSAILDMPPGEIFDNPGLFHLEHAVLKETLKVMDTAGIKVVDLPATPVRLLAFSVRALPRFLSKPLLSRAIGSGRGDKMPSFHIDLYLGSSNSEITSLHGAVARFGQKFNIPTPVCQFLTHTLVSLTNKNIPLDTYRHNPAKLIAHYQNF